MVILGLGGNLGNRSLTLQRAIDLLKPVLHDMRLSRIYETPAMMPPGAPKSWNMPFLNMAVMGDTSLSPDELLVAVKNIEKKLGRAEAERWAPRIIDIDILAMDNLVHHGQHLNVPHHGLLDRDFALLPLAELAPDWRYPGAGEFHEWKAADIVRAKGYSVSSLNDKGISYYG